ncbi:MAG: glutamate--tRNA ligase [Gammaproteobacteria bacterium]|nr:glutamate--tRNA ligase [Gammaproteobacteria bacterium]
MTVRTRFAPSPTGDLHIGGVRTAFFSWLHARRHGGQFVLRIEDTDRQRSSDASAALILESMTWLGLEPDEPVYYQSRRFDRYREASDRLLAEGKAYHCYCSKQLLDDMRAEQVAQGLKPRYDRRCRHRQSPPPAGVEPVLRFMNPLQGNVVIDDQIQGRVVISNTELDDLIIQRSDGTPTYNFTVVVDDADMGITDVIRGDDHLNNTPRQINLFAAIGALVPRFAHVPMILGADGKRLSKRHGAGSVLEYRDAGYLAEAMLNYLVRLGWSHGDREVFSINELMELFRIEDVNKSASIFNSEKLDWLNQHYIKSGDPEDIAKRVEPLFAARGLDTGNGPALVDVVTAQKQRAKTLVELVDKSEYFYRDADGYGEAGSKHLTANVLPALVGLAEHIERMNEWNVEALHSVIADVAGTAGLKFGKLAQPVRVAVSGGVVSPSIDVTLWLIGQARVLGRLKRAIAFIESTAADSG